MDSGFSNIRSGPVRHSVDHSAPSIWVPLPSSNSNRSQRPVPRLERVGQDLSFSSYHSSLRSGRDSSVLPGPRNPNSPLLARSPLVPLLAGKGSRSSSPSQPSRMETKRAGLHRMGLSGAMANLVLNCHRPNTLGQYLSVWKKILTFRCTEHQKGCNVIQLNFLFLNREIQWEEKIQYGCRVFLCSKDSYALRKGYPVTQMESQWSPPFPRIRNIWTLGRETLPQEISKNSGADPPRYWQKKHWYSNSL